MKANDISLVANPPAATSSAEPKQRACPYLHESVPNPLDLQLQSAVAKLTGGVSPIALSLAFQDWFMHLAASPGKQSDLMRLSNAEVDFVLASGGHNAGIVSEPGHARRGYRSMPHRAADSAYISPDEWLQTADHADGSWWPHWQQWLVAHSSEEHPSDANAALKR